MRIFSRGGTVDEDVFVQERDSRITNYVLAGPVSEGMVIY